MNMKISRRVQKQQQQQESDFSEDQYKRTLHQFLKDPQWKQTVQIVHLTIKLFEGYVQKLADKINEHHIVIDQVQVKTKQLEVSGINKISKKEVASIVQKEIKENREMWIQDHSHSNSLISREQGLDRVMIQQVKTIVQQINQSRQRQILEKASENNRIYQSQIQHLNFQYSKVETQIQSISSQMHFYQQKNDEAVIYHRKLQHRLLLIQQALTRQTNDFLDYIRRDNIQKMYSSQTANVRSRTHNLSEITQKKTPNTFRKQISALEEKILQITKDTVQHKQFSQLKMRVSKESAETVKFDKFQQLLSKTQCQITDKLNSVVKQFTALDKRFSQEFAKIETKNTKQEQQTNVQTKQINKKSKQPKSKSKLKTKKEIDNDQKTMCPSQSVKQIKDSLHRMETALIEKGGSASFKQLQRLLVSQIQVHKQFVQQETSKRQKKICQFVQHQLKTLKAGIPQRQFEKGTLSKSVQILAQHMIHCRYLFTGQKQVKGAITWQKEAANLMQQNFRWRQGQTYILVEAKGLYKIQGALFGQKDIQCYLQFNGQPVAIFKASDIPQNSQRHSRGYVFSQAMILPAHVKISIRSQNSFYGQAYLQINRL